MVDIARDIREQGIEQGIRKSIVAILDLLDDNQIAERMEVSLEMVKEIRKENQRNQEEPSTLKKGNNY